MTDPSKDSDVRNDGTEHSASFGVGAHSEWSGYQGSGAVNVGPFDVLRLDPVADLPPGLKLAAASGVSGLKLANGDAEWAELQAVMAGATDLGINVALYLADPFNFLISTGLTFLIDVVQPLEDLLGLFTGNPERMEGEIAKWTRVDEALEPLAQELRDIAQTGLIGWEGKAADEAKARLLEFTEGMVELKDGVAQLMFVMNIAKAIMEVTQAFLIGLAATFIEWLVYTWTAALAAAPVTAGASTAAAGAATGVQAALVSSRAATFITRVVKLLKQLRLILTRMHRARMKRVQVGFQKKRPGGGGFAKGWVTPQQAFLAALKDPLPYYQAGAQFVNTAISEVPRIADNVGEDADSATSRKLDPDR